MKPLRLARWIVPPLIAVAIWLGLRCRNNDPAPEQSARAGERAPAGREQIVFRDGKWVRLDDNQLVELMRDLANRKPGLVRVSGAVVDSESGEPVPGAEVVFASDLGESSIGADEAGRYTIEIHPGFYRAFARAEGYVAVGRAELERLPASPDASLAGMPRGELAPLVGLFRDQRGVDMHMHRGGRIVGTVYDTAGRPIAGAVVTGHPAGYWGARARLVLGTDMDESDLDGSFQLDVAAGPLELGALHEEFAGLASPVSVYLSAGETAQVQLTMKAGCIISGRVVDVRGQPTGEGSIEVESGGEPPNDFAPAGKLDSQGRFRLARTDEDTLRLRAWPWKSPPTAATEISCYDGTRYRDLTLVVPDAVPDLEGSVWSASGEPVAQAYIDIQPLDHGGMAQQERANIYGEWAFYSLPAGRYQLTAYVPGKGAAAAMVTVPGRGVRVSLSGTGFIQGTVQGMESGSFTFTMSGCLVRMEGGDTAVIDEYSMPQTTRIVPVESGVFYIDDVPACPLQATIRMQSRIEEVSIDVLSGQTAQLALDLREAQPTLARGLVMDGDRVPVAGVMVSRVAGPGAPRDPHSSARTDGEGRFEIQAYTGDRLLFRGDDGWAEAEVGWSQDEDERIDVMLER